MGEGKGGKTKDDSGKGLEAELEGKCKWVKGKFGNAIEFDGKSAYVKTKPHANPTKAITVSAWVKRSSTSKILISGICGLALLTAKQANGGFWSMVKRKVNSSWIKNRLLPKKPKSCG